LNFRALSTLKLTSMAQEALSARQMLTIIRLPIDLPLYLMPFLISQFAVERSPIRQLAARGGRQICHPSVFGDVGEPIQHYSRVANMYSF